jgi:hypothetical protein
MLSTLVAKRRKPSGISHQLRKLPGGLRRFATKVEGIALAPVVTATHHPTRTLLVTPLAVRRLPRP